MEEAWHTDSDMQAAVETFHKEFATFPFGAIEEAKKTLTPILEEIQSHLRNKGICDRYEPAGSSYQGIKITGGLEFDVLFEIDGRGIIHKPTPGRPSHCLLVIPPRPPNQRDRLRKIFKGCVKSDDRGKDIISSLSFSKKAITQLLLRLLITPILVM